MPSESSPLGALIAAFLTAGALAGVAVGARVYVDGLPEDAERPALLTALADAAPWTPGEPLPVLRVLNPFSRKAVEEDERTGAVVAVESSELPAASAAASAGDPIPGDGPPAGEASIAGGSTSSGLASPVGGATAAPAAGVPDLASRLPSRPPTLPTPLVDADHKGMTPFYAALARGTGLARAAHYGDSTIAADGITGTVRRRLQARFGDGGPGWVDAGLDPQWSARPDLKTRRSGDWETHSILLAGGSGRYGYGGVVSRAPDGGSLSVSAPPPEGKAASPLTHLELWYQAGAGHGTAWLNADGARVQEASAGAERRDDRRIVADLPAPATKVSFGASGAPVPFYGVVLETAGPGVVWDALGVVGVGTRSFTTYFDKEHLRAQVAQRAPDLVVVMLGGNELGVPALQRGDGAGYATGYRDTLHMLRAGAPNAGCLVVTPLDQGTREGGKPTTKPSLKRLVKVLRGLAAEEGCAFWDAYAAMGGEGAIVSWTRRKPPLAWTDLLHLSADGQDLVGQALADAIEAGYDDWTARGGAAAEAAAPKE